MGDREATPSEIDIVSRPLVSHPDSEGSQSHQGKMHKVLMNLHCETTGISLRTPEQML